MFGDAKTIENVAKFVRDMQERRANIQSEVFLKALTVIQEVPGDWHTGVNMLSSIYNVYYHGFLEEFQGLLHWKWENVKKDVRSCYFQVSWLATFVHDELCQLFIHIFVSDCGRHEDEIYMSPSDFITCVAIDFSV